MMEKPFDYVDNPFRNAFISSFLEGNDRLFSVYFIPSGCTLVTDSLFWFDWWHWIITRTDTIRSPVSTAPHSHADTRTHTDTQTQSALNLSLLHSPYFCLHLLLFLLLFFSLGPLVLNLTLTLRGPVWPLPTDHMMGDRLAVYAAGQHVLNLRSNVPLQLQN